MGSEVKEWTATGEVGVAKTETTTRDAEDTAELVDILEGYLSALGTIDKKLLDCGRNDMRFPSAQRLVNKWINRLKGEYRVTYAGEAARMRKALRLLLDTLEAVGFCPFSEGDPLARAAAAARAVLDAPPRNCDIGETDDQQYRFERLCNAFSHCAGCPVHKRWGKRPKSCGII